MTSTATRRPRSAPGGLMASVSFALVGCVLAVFKSVAMAALVFSGPLGRFTGVGTGIYLTGAVVLGVIVALFSATIPDLALVQEAPVAVLGVLAAGMVAGMTSAASDAAFATVIATTLVATMVTGVCMWLMGRFGLGQLVRFIPYPVGAGFLAGTGLLLVVGGVKVATTRTDFGVELLSSHLLVRWLPALGFGVVMLILVRQFHQFYVLPGLLIGGIGVFYACYFLVNGSLSGLDAGHWLLGPFPDGQLLDVVALTSIGDADWGRVLANAVGAAVVVLITVVTLLLNAAGLEIATRSDLDLDKELRVTGVANVAISLLGCPPGTMSVGMSSLGHRLGVRRRLGSLLAFALTAVFMVFGAGMLAEMPRMVAGGLLIFLGLVFLVDWLYETWSALPLHDYLLIWAIVIVTATVGFLAGVAAGIAIAATLFLVDYSKANVIRHSASRRLFTSATVRSPLFEQLLEDRGDRVWIVTLQGHLFFGTAHRLVDHIRSRLAGAEGRHLRFVVLDLHLVNGLDSSAVFSFTRLRQATADSGVTFVLTGLAPDIGSRLRDVLSDGYGDDPERGQPWLTLPTLDDGVSWCEDRLIDDFRAVGLADEPASAVDVMTRELRTAAGPVDWLNFLNPEAGPATSERLDTFLAHLERVEFGPGEVLCEPDSAPQAIMFLTEGMASYTTHDADGALTDAGVMRPGSDIGVAAFYAGRPARQEIVTARAGTMLRLTRSSLAELERAHPDIAVLLHRTLAGQLGRRTARLEEITRALQE